jgi:hypothetical protein
MNTTQKMEEQDERVGRYDWLYRALSLLAIMVGAGITGAGVIPLHAATLVSVGMSPSVIVFALICLGTVGICLRGFHGGVLLFVACSLLSAVLFGGMIPDWLTIFGILITMPGIGYQIFFPE